MARARPSRPVPATFAVLVLSFLLLIAGVASAPTDTITWGGDNMRHGYQDNHNMDPSVVGSAQFGQVFKAPLPGNYRGIGQEQIFSQPLVYTADDGKHRDPRARAGLG